MTSKHWTILLCLFPIIGTFAQTTHEPYVLIQQERGPSTSNVWVLAWVDRPADGESPRKGNAWWHWYRERGGVEPSGLPVLVEMESGLQTPLTGTVAQAIAALDAMYSEQRPGLHAYKGRDQREEARKDRAAKGANPNAAAKRGDMLELTRQIEALIERVQMLEARQ